MRAAPRYQVSAPAGAADSVGSPAPTSTTGPCEFWLVATTRVLIRACRSRVSSAAVAVRTLLVDAGSNGTSSSRCQSSCPVMASVMRPPSLPRLGSAAAAASAAARPPALGVGAVSATGTTPGLTVGARGGGTDGRAPALRLPRVKYAAAATKAATNASTTTPKITPVDFRQRLDAMTLLSVRSHSAEPAARLAAGLGWIR